MYVANIEFTTIESAVEIKRNSDDCIENLKEDIIVPLIFHECFYDKKYYSQGITSLVYLIF